MKYNLGNTRRRNEDADYPPELPQQNQEQERRENTPEISSDQVTREDLQVLVWMQEANLAFQRTTVQQILDINQENRKQNEKNQEWMTTMKLYVDRKDQIVHEEIGNLKFSNDGLKKDMKQLKDKVLQLEEATFGGPHVLDQKAHCSKAVPQFSNIPQMGPETVSSAPRGDPEAASERTRKGGSWKKDKKQCSFCKKWLSASCARNHEMNNRCRVSN